MERRKRANKNERGAGRHHEVGRGSAAGARRRTQSAVCPYCGKPIDANAAFCQHCGAPLIIAQGVTQAFAPVDASTTSVMPAVEITPDATTLFTAVGAEEHDAPEETIAEEHAPLPAMNQCEQDAYVKEGAATHYQATHDPNKRSPLRKVLIAIVAVLVAAGLSGGVYAGYHAWQDSQARELAHQAHTVHFELNAPGYDPETDSKIKMHVMGTDLDGQNVLRDVFIMGEGDSIDLLMGDYQMTIDTSPLTASGDVLVLQDLVQFTVDDQEFAEPTVELTFTSADLSTITNDQVMAMYESAVASGMPEEDASALRRVTLDKVERARSALYNDPEARAKAEADAALREAHHIATDDFEFDIPSEWWNQVEWRKVSRYGHAGIDVYLKGREDLVLCSVSCSNDPDDIDAGGDVVSHQIGYKTLGNKYVDVWTTSYTYLAMDSEVAKGLEYSESDLAELVPLATGGTMTYEKASKLATNEYRSYEGQFQQRTIFASLVVL